MRSHFVWKGGTTIILIRGRKYHLFLTNALYFEVCKGGYKRVRYFLCLLFVFFLSCFEVTPHSLSQARRGLVMSVAADW